MSIELETAELTIDTVGIEAAQQALDALGVETDLINATASADDRPEASVRETPQANQANGDLANDRERPRDGGTGRWGDGESDRDVDQRVTADETITDQAVRRKQ